MKRRTQGQASIDALMKTICRIQNGSSVPSEAALPPPSMSGRLQVAPITKVAQEGGVHDGAFVSYWVELRSDVLTFVKSDPQGGGKTFKPTQVSFCTIVDPPPASVCTSTELRAVASKLVAKKYLAVYTPEKYAIWLDFTNDTVELERWQGVRAALRLSPP